MSKFNSPIHRSAKNGDYKSLQLELNAGVDPNLIDSDWSKNSALHYASMSGNLKCVKLLLDRGACPNQRNSVGIVPLNFCRERDNLDIACLLLERGASTDAGVLIDQMILLCAPDIISVVFECAKTAEVDNALEKIVTFEPEVLGIIKESGRFCVYEKEAKLRRRSFSW